MKLMVWYRAALSSLAAAGQSPTAGESPTAFAERLLTEGSAGEEFKTLAERVALNRYADQRPDEDAFAQADACYRALVKRLKPMPRARWLLRRLTKGMGDFRQIP